MTSYNRDYWMAFGAHQKPTVGDMKFSAAQYDHLGWLICDGSTKNVSEFQFLFNVIGYSFGGSGAQFNLPNPAGRVPGAIGTGADSISSTFTIALGDKIGEYQHQLTIPEMPSHNHGVAGGGQVSTNNSTSVVSITLNDTLHSHTNNATGPTPTGNGYGLAYQNGSNTQNGSVNNGNEPNLYQPLLPLTIDSAYTGNTLSNGVHAHTLNPAGLDKYHNNVQPTIGMGNMFIYSGRPLVGSYPYTTGKNLW